MLTPAASLKGGTAVSECGHARCEPFDECESVTPECNGRDGCPHVMQPRCTWCKREQWALALYPISHGLRGCTWCRTVPKVYTDEGEYRADLEREPWTLSGT